MDPVLVMVHRLVVVLAQQHPVLHRGRTPMLIVLNMVDLTIGGRLPTPRRSTPPVPGDDRPPQRGREHPPSRPGIHDLTLSGPAAREEFFAELERWSRAYVTHDLGQGT